MAGSPEAEAFIDSADIIHIHNYLLPPLEERLRLGDKQSRTMAQFHSLPRMGEWTRLWNFTPNRFTIRQPLQMEEYKIPDLPNMIDPDEYRPNRRTIGAPIRIAFAPTTKAAIGHPASKGYAEVKEVLDKVARIRAVEIVWIEGMGYEDNLKKKATADILIDDVITGNFHRTSLEGACFACAVLNACRKFPWIYTTIKTLEAELIELIDHAPALRLHQEITRAWIESEWHPIEQTKEYEAAYKRILNDTH
jgi:hypothetical protein